MKTLISALCLLTAFPALAAPFDMFRDCDECPEMIELPLGAFMMGAPEGEARFNIVVDDEGLLQLATPENPYIAYHEGPVHRVEIDIPIAMGRNEVTFDQWMRCVDGGGCNGYIPDVFIHPFLPDDDGSNDVAVINGSRPVINVSYHDAVAYTSWLNIKVGADVYRLPTEAEWEYAARAGTQTPFAQGNDILPSQANYYAGNPKPLWGSLRTNVVSHGVPVPVETLDAANAWGLRHMSGNVIELTLSCWTERHETWGMSSTYLARDLAQEKCHRVTRGGSFLSALEFLRLGSRGKVAQDSAYEFNGFRIVREMRTPNP